MDGVPSSVTSLTLFFCFRAQRGDLCYLFAFLFLFSGSETGSLLPFRLSFPVFGLRDGLSVTFSPFFSCFRAQRRALCYLSAFLFLFSGSETGSLLPFRLSFPVFGLRDGLSVTFPSFFSY